MGWKPKMPKKHGHQIAMAAGGSWAGVGHKKAEADTTNRYKAMGKYKAGGENFSEAGLTKTHTEVIKVGDMTKKTTTTKSIRVFAGGYSSAYSL